MATRNTQNNNQVGYYDNASATPRNKQVRRINNDFEYLNSKELSPYATNDEQFNADYQTKGLQPQTRSRVKKPRKQFEEEDTMSEETYAAEQQAEVMFNDETNQNNLTTQVARSLAKRKALNKILARTRASAVNTSIFAWAGSLWLSVQLPFAIISLVTMGISATVSEAVAATGFVGNALGWAASMLAEGVSMVAGININLASAAESFYLVAYVIVFAIGVFSLITAYLQYTLALLKPLGGKESGLKMGIFLLAIIGYSIPLANMFPWILIFAAVVWKYPR